jgi:hypothetical protein
MSTARRSASVSGIDPSGQSPVTVAGAAPESHRLPSYRFVVQETTSWIDETPERLACIEHRLGRVKGFAWRRLLAVDRRVQSTATSRHYGRRSRGGLKENGRSRRYAWMASFGVLFGHGHGFNLRNLRHTGASPRWPGSLRDDRAAGRWRPRCRVRMHREHLRASRS